MHNLLVLVISTAIMVASCVGFANCLPSASAAAVVGAKEDHHHHQRQTSKRMLPGEDPSIVMEGSGSQLIRLMLKVSSGMDNDGTALMELCKIHAALSSIAEHVNEVIVGAVGTADVCSNAMLGTFLHPEAKSKDEYFLVDPSD